MTDILFLVLIYGFCMGSIYLLVSLGFSIICVVLRIFHLGYAYIFPLAVYGTWMFMQELGWGLVPSILGMFAVQFAVSYFIYRGMITRYLEKEEILLTGLLLVALIVEQGANYLYPIQAGVFLDTTLVEGTSQLGVTMISSQLLAGSIIALLLTALFVLFFVKTRIGLAVRALSQDIRSSRIVGINVEALYVFTMMFVLVPVIIGVLIVAPVWTL